MNKLITLNTLTNLETAKVLILVECSIMKRCKKIKDLNEFKGKPYEWYKSRVIHDDIELIEQELRKAYQHEDNITIYISLGDIATMLYNHLG